MGAGPNAKGGGTMNRLCALLFVAIVTVSLSAQDDQWAALRSFEGKWQGSTSGKPGK